MVNLLQCTRSVHRAQTLASFPGLHAQLLSLASDKKLGVEAWERGYTDPAWKADVILLAPCRLLSSATPMAPQGQHVRPEHSAIAVY